jgi:SAM-dependent methyltransferase
MTASKKPDPVCEQYEAYPYPERSPVEEKIRLVTGSPSHPVEIDHFIFGGCRDWRKPIKILVAGGGTGDALIMIAQLLKNRAVPAEIHYIDPAKASRKIAEDRAHFRGLDHINFHTTSLENAADFGPFDYIDCCGVLHHLPDPEYGFRALSNALAPSGGMGLMVYAPYGRRGVYELQNAFSALVADLSPREKVVVAKKVLRNLPKTAALASNPWVADHKNGDAGLYDLLLHSRDQPFTVERIRDALAQADLRLAGWVEPGRYDPKLLINDQSVSQRVDHLSYWKRAALAEQLAGNIKTHRFYAVLNANTFAPPVFCPESVPVIHNAPADKLAKSIAQTGKLSFTVNGLTFSHKLDRASADLVRHMTGKMTAGEIVAKANLNWEFGLKRLSGLSLYLGNFNHLRFSRFFADQDQTV